jgi:hypothetical protein
MVIEKLFQSIVSIFSQTSNLSVEPTPEPTASEVKLACLDRQESMITGSQFISSNMKFAGKLREENVLKEIASGNIPDFLKCLKPVTIKSGDNTLIYYVTPDYLSIGSDEDYCRMPMAAPTGKKIADMFECTLPTKKMVDDIYKQADIKLEARPHGPPYDSSMESTERFDWSNKAIEKQLVGMDKSQLIAGHKKDIVIDKNLLNRKNNVGIYGWFLNGAPIQGPIANVSSHELNYCDYSQLIRLISVNVIYNGKTINFYDALKDPDISSLLSDQGPYDASRIYA